MHWLQLIFVSDPEGSETLSAVLEACGASAVTLQDAADQPLFDTSIRGEKEQTFLWDQTRVIALFDETHDPVEIIKTIKQVIPNIPPHEVLPLQDQDWERTWMTRFKPMRFTSALSSSSPEIWVCPSWEAPPKPDAINLILDPGMAFGTGTHETTALCLEWLAGSASDITTKKIIDYGCGSGILAIAAAKLGAKCVWAVDIEQQALENTLENARTNQVDKQLRISGPAGFPENLQVDLVIANILANPLVQLAPRFADFLATNANPPPGEIILSGIIADQVPLILDTYASWFSFSEPVYKNEWALLAGQRRSP